MKVPARPGFLSGLLKRPLVKLVSIAACHIGAISQGKCHALIQFAEILDLLALDMFLAANID